MFLSVQCGVAVAHSDGQLPPLQSPAIGKWSTSLALAMVAAPAPVVEVIAPAPAAIAGRFSATMVTLCGLALLSLLPVLAQGHTAKERGLQRTRGSCGGFEALSSALAASAPCVWHDHDLEHVAGEQA